VLYGTEPWTKGGNNPIKIKRELSPKANNGRKINNKQYINRGLKVKVTPFVPI
jgi:hypothetical protein